MPEVTELEARLDRLLTARPDLTEAADLQRELLQEAYRAAPSVWAPELTREQARQKLSEGVPLLDREAVDPDIDFCQDLFGRLLNRLQRRPTSAEAIAAIAHAAAAGEVDVNDALIEALAGHADHVIEIATRALVPSDALVGILELVVRPSLQALASALQPLLSDPEAWSRGYCLVCGAWPGLAELQLAEQHRHLRCLRCGADWPARRLLCVYCGNDEFNMLGYLQVERELRFRVEICERCKGYLKVANAFQPNEPEALVLDDLASVHLDLAALERGYTRPSGAGFRMTYGREELPGLADTGSGQH